MNVAALFTTNIDNLLHRVFADARYAYINDLDVAGPTFADRRAIDLAMLHGSVLSRERPLRFSTLDIASSFSADPDRWRYLRHRLRKSPTLFWGYSLQDAASLEALSGIASEGKDVWILLLERERDSALVEYFRALRFQTIFGDTGSLLDYIDTVTPQLTPSVGHNDFSDTYSLFPNESVPRPTSVPQRPLTDFFSGAAPAWSDVYSGRLHRVEALRKVTDHINRRVPLLVTGIPQSGKTTVLMQVAATTEFNGYTLMLDGPTLAKAKQLLRVLGGRPALVLLDNVTNDLTAFNALVDAPNVVVVGADRDYQLSQSIHKLDRTKVKIIDTTELSDIDMHALRQSIPEAIRRPVFARPETSRGVRPSLLELIQANTTTTRITDRFRDAMRTLRATDATLAEMVLLVAYVHWARTPLSKDMALGYWRDEVSDFRSIYELVTSAGATLHEYEGDLSDSDQDYFGARSVLVAETILEGAPARDLAHLLRKFNANVSPVRIAYYHVFRRRGYDADLVSRAFIEVEEGVEFYDAVHEKDASPYTLQQKALFLARRRRYEDAFAVIDEAVASSRGKNWTIRNSHAQILFRANIDKVGDYPDARSLLDRSMTTLETCYRSDRRKAWHAMVYSDHSLKYSSVFRDARAIEYLTQAERWLEEVSVQEPWLRRVPNLLTAVRARLRDLDEP